MNMAILESALEVVRSHLPACRPRVACILGSGWSTACDALNIRRAVAYEDIPGLGAPTVTGHAGRLLLCSERSGDYLVFQGRRHWYEGLGWEPVAVPPYLCRCLGIQTVLLTNAAGGIRKDLAAGSLMLIRDHINVMGVNPLVGPWRKVWGARFPDQTAVYDKDLASCVRRSADSVGVALGEGVYAAVSGPTYETPAEVRALQALGADAVGMSTVPEAILLNAAGVRVAALSCITNIASGLGVEPLSHAEVLASTQQSAPRMTALLQSCLTELINDDKSQKDEPTDDEQ